MRSDHAGNVRSTAFKLGVTLSAPLLGLVALEALLRLRAHYRGSTTLEAAFEVPGPAEPGERTRFIDIIRPHPSDRIIYELRPSLRTTFKDAPLTTNSHGFRGPEVPLEPAEDTLTIVGIGASIMFGHGVGDDEVYPMLLERRLNEAYPAKRWRFVNTAVPSYNVVMKVATLKEKGLAFRPDLVLLNVASNNLGLPTYLHAEEAPLDLGRSFLLDLVRGRAAERERALHLARVTRSQLSWAEYVRTDPAKVPARYRHLVGWPAFHAAMDELARLRDEHGFEVVVFATLDVEDVTGMLAAARERGFAVVTLHDQLGAWLRAHGSGEISVERYLASELVVSPGNSHPSPLQHRMAAERILAELEAQGVIERLLARP